MKKYYLIPIDSPLIKINGVSFSEYLKANYHDLFIALLDYKALLEIRNYDEEYFTEISKQYFEMKKLVEIEKLLEYYQLPRHLVCVLNPENNTLYEIESRINFDLDKNDLWKYECSEDKIGEYLTDEYLTRIINLFTLNQELLLKQKSCK